MQIKLTDSAEVAGKQEKPGAVLTVDPASGRYLIAKKKAVEIEPDKAEKAEPATKAKTTRTRSKK